MMLRTVEATTEDFIRFNSHIRHIGRVILFVESMRMRIRNTTI
jgi:hypothetical protein